MKKIIFLIILQLFSSCHSQEGPEISAEEKKEISDFFGIKGNVKVIDSELEMITSSGKRKYRTVTSFYRNGVPKETKMFENDKLEKTEPWRLRTKKDEKGWELVKEFDANKRLLKATQYNAGKAVSEINYRYNQSSKKIEEYDNIRKTKITFSYDKLGNLSEETEYQDSQNHWYSKKKHTYDNKKNLIETITYKYPEEKKHDEKITYKYDPEGSIIESNTYDQDNIIMKKKINKISYY